jgi:flagellar assembly factor FliW
MTTNPSAVGREIQSLHFGKFTLEPDSLFTFADGLLGFEELKQFVLVSDESTVPFKWLISVDSPDIGLPLLSPWLIDLNYRPGKHAEGEDMAAFVVVTLSNIKGMTANMKAPIIFDTNTQTGKQIILPSDKYRTDFVIKGNNN